LKLPRKDFTSINDVYNNNETYNTGRYPVSQNDHWHSGIHINFVHGAAQQEVYPLINGELAAYRISKEYRTVPRPNIISSSEWEKLLRQERELYRPVVRLFSTDYELKPDGIQPEYLNGRYSNSFVMLRHYFTVKKKDGTDEKIPFFTLYTNIAPLADQFVRYSPLQEALKPLPFYGAYSFRISEAIKKAKNAAYLYIEREGVKLFPGSHCSFRENANNPNIYDCCFDNFSNTAKRVNISKGNIELLNCVPLQDGVPVYNTNLSAEIQKDPDNPEYADDLESFRLTTLKTNAFFYGDIIEKEKFYEVTVNKNEVHQGDKIEERQRVLVRKNAFKTRGRLKKLNENDTLDWRSAEGMMVYDRGDANGNVRGVKSAGDEFGLAEPEKLLNAAAAAVFFLLKPDTGNAQPKYILLRHENRNLVEVKAVWNDSYKRNGEITQPPPVISENTVIGYCYQPPLYRNAYYDIVLLFKDIDFMNNQEQYQPVEWKKFFRVLGRKTSGIGEAFNGLDFIKNNYNWSNDDRNAGAVLGDSESNWWRVGRGGESSASKSIKRSIVCGHPLEWDKSLYVENGNVKHKARRAYGVGDSRNDQDDFIARVEAVDIWTELKDKNITKLDPNENNFWFAHPVYFINHLDRAGLLDRSYNPYDNSEISEQWNIGRILEKKDVVVRDNPGFAPAWEEGAVQNGQVFTANGFSYTVPTGLFNQQYYNPSPNLGIYNHEGVDFRGRDGTTPVHALIHAKVVYIGIKPVGKEHVAYGQYIILQSETEKNNFYMIAHLNKKKEGIEIGTIVNPGDTVAYVGKTGTTASHLHLSFFKPKTGSSIFDRENGFDRSNELRNEFNPFDHNDPYVDIHRNRRN